MVVLAGLALFVALPLSLVRDLENLQYICASRYPLPTLAHLYTQFEKLHSSILFYVFVVLRVVLQASTHITSG